MKRHFANFLDAYVECVDNGFAPRIFHTWSGISLLSALAERKVWCRLNSKKLLFPNNYNFLVARPGIGKSSAIDVAKELLGQFNRERGGKVKLLPTSISNAELINQLSGSSQPLNLGPAGPKVVVHTSGFYIASEGSNSFTPIGGSGDLIPLFTDWYDSPSVWERAIKGKGNGEHRMLHNLCINIIGGITYDFLATLITDSNIGGGFASRVNYIVYDGVLIRNGELEDEATPLASEMLSKLLDDMAQIHSLVGQFTYSPGYREQYREWLPQFETMRQNLASEKLQSLLVRTPVSVRKVSMILAIAESNSLVLEAHHWERALALVTEAGKAIPSMLRTAKASRTNEQEGLVQAVFLEFGKTPGAQIKQGDLRQKLTLRGFDPQKVSSTLDSMLADKTIQLDLTGTSANLRLLVNPDSHL